MNSNIKFYITESLFYLLKTKDIKEIKITEIAKLSNISRTTLYNNFKNITEIINYKLNLIVDDIIKIYTLNSLRKKINKELLINILKYINNNKEIILIIKNKLFFEFKNNLDIKFINILNSKYDYYIKSGIYINLCLFYINNNFNIELDKIKID